MALFFNTLISYSLILLNNNIKINYDLKVFDFTSQFIIYKNSTFNN